jgi:hypothetical protein
MNAWVVMDRDASDVSGAWHRDKRATTAAGGSR